MSEFSIDQSDKGKIFNLRRGDKIVVSLDENPTTGYRWSVHNDADGILTLTDSDFTAIGDAGIGSGGTRKFVFNVSKLGSGSLVLKNWREWAGEDSVIHWFDISVEVSD